MDAFFTMDRPPRGRIRTDQDYHFEVDGFLTMDRPPHGRIRTKDDKHFPDAPVSYECY